MTITNPYQYEVVTNEPEETRELIKCTLTNKAYSKKKGQKVKMFNEPKHITCCYLNTFLQL